MSSELLAVNVPDIGGAKDVEVIELSVAVGDRVANEDILLTLESDKAAMEIPAPASGIVRELKLALGDKVSEGGAILVLEVEAAASSEALAEKPAVEPPSAPEAVVPAPEAALVSTSQTVSAPPPAAEPSSGLDKVLKPYASPSVRQFARELGVDLSQVAGTGRKQRIVREDISAYVKAVVAGGASNQSAGQSGLGLDIIPWPRVDFAKFGPVRTEPLSRIKKISGANLHRNWVSIPHVTNHDKTDITDLEAFRVSLNRRNEKAGIKVTMLAFIVKACVAALKKFPQFNASLDGDQLVLKEYYHIGVAADTPKGLVVPVIRDADQKGIIDIAEEMSALAAKARAGKLSPAEMQGGTFSISSLGGIGGTYFNPIINAPEVAILGVCRAVNEPHWDGEGFVPRLMMPISLAWDHRVVDGAEAARFNAYLGQVLADFRYSML